ncbi:MAG TPA: AbrB/MazE/SpoVT family DNA-binding domain-containing protein [Chloroflexota bacterium]|jgi:putative addiction module antidote
MITQKLRKVGNSYVVTIPRAEVERQQLHEGDLVDVQVTPLEVRRRLPPDLQAAAEASLREHSAAYRYLAEH